MISKHHSITNTSDKFLLVGNSSDVIAAYDSEADAMSGTELAIPNIDASKWGVVRILAPGATDSGEYCQRLPKTASQQAEADKQFQEFFKA